MAALGLIKRKEIWIPTLRGWVALLLLLVGVAVTALFWTVPFLAPMSPEGRGVLVVEGWLPDYALAEAKRTFEAHPYQRLVVTGVPIDQGFHISREKDYAQLAATTLKAMGIKSEAVVAVSCPEVPRDRTYATACKVRAWLDAEHQSGPVDVFTLGVHARRTWLLYRIALAQREPIGIIASADQRFNARQWWKTSSGFRIVTSEVIAHLYAKLLFVAPAE